MKKLLFIIVLSCIAFAAFGQRENLLPMKSSSAVTDTMRVIKDNQSALMLRSTWQSDLYDSIATHTDTLQALRADIVAGGSSQLMDSINQHRIEIDNLHDSIAGHRIDIDANLDSIADHRTELNNLHDSIADHRTDINTNTGNISTNATNISSNSVFIGVNTADIASLEDSIAKHTDTLQLHQTQIAALQTDNDSSWVKVYVDTIDQYNTAGVSIEGTLFNDDNVFFKTSGVTYLTTEKLGSNAHLSTSTGTGIRLVPGTGGAFGVGPSMASNTFATIRPQAAITSVLDVLSSTGSGTIFAAEDNGTAYFPLLGSDDAEDHVVAIDDATGLLTKRSVASIGGGSYWTRTGTDLSPATSGDDILLGLSGADERIFWGDGDTYLYEASDDNLQLNTGGSVAIIFGSSLISVSRPFIAGADNTYDIGASGGNHWQDLFLKGRVYFGDDDSYIYESSDDIIVIGVGGVDVLDVTSAGLVVDGRITAAATDTDDLGSAVTYWQDVYAQQYYIDDGLTYIDVSSNDLRLTDANAGTLELTELATGFEYQNINEETSSSYTLVIGDAGGLIDYDYNGSSSITVPPNSSVAFPIGTRIRICKTDTGNLNINEGTGVTINNWNTAPAVREDGCGELIKIATNEWMLTGDIIQDA